MSKEVFYVCNISCALLYGPHCVALGGFNDPVIRRSGLFVCFAWNKTHLILILVSSVTILLSF